MFWSGLVYTRCHGLDKQLSLFLSSNVIKFKNPGKSEYKILLLNIICFQPRLTREIWIILKFYGESVSCQPSMTLSGICQPEWQTLIGQRRVWIQREFKRWLIAYQWYCTHQEQPKVDKIPFINNKIHLYKLRYIYK